MAVADFWLARRAQERRKQAKRYFSRHGLDLISPEPQNFGPDVAPDLDLVVVIPALAEPDLSATLDSLQACALPRQSRIEILVLINHSTDAPEAIVEANRRLACELSRRPAGPIPEHVMTCELPHQHAGVGLARKLGLDLALKRLTASESGGGLMLCLDADCLVQPNYLQAVAAYFARYPEASGASVYFEHNLDRAQNPLAIAQYELHLRYFVHSLREAGMPWVFHTVGSCMVVTTDAYMGQGGMNRRQAGEDYYFVQKLAQGGGFGDLTDTVVFPSARESWRVPFGTGRAMASLGSDHGNSPEGAVWLTYDPTIFVDLGAWLSAIPRYFDAAVGPAAEGHRPVDVQAMDRTITKSLPGSVQSFLLEVNWPDRLAEIRANTASADAFVRRVSRWFNNFMAMKFVHYATDHGHPKVPIAQAAGVLLESAGRGPAGVDCLELLAAYRRWCRNSQG